MTGMIVNLCLLPFVAAHERKHRGGGGGSLAEIIDAHKSIGNMQIYTKDNLKYKYPLDFYLKVPKKLLLLLSICQLYPDLKHIKINLYLLFHDLLKSLYIFLENSSIHF